MEKIKLLKNNKELMKEYNYHKNRDVDLDTLKLSAHKKIWWKCGKGHEWQAFVYCRREGTKCPICANQKVLVGYNDLGTTNPRIAKEWNYKKNDLTPEQVTSGSNKIVWWRCEKGHEWENSVNKRNRGENCPYCSGHRVLKGFNDLKTWCIKNNREDLIKEFDKEKNKFTMTDITFGSGKMVWWKCKNGHSYKTTLHHRINMKTGCGKCSHKVFESGVNDLVTTNPELAKEWDYEKNKVGPSEVMAGSNNKKYWFICPKGHSYKTALLNRKRGTNCPICSMERHTSFPEKAIYFYLQEKFNDVVDSYHNPVIGNKEIDIYLPKWKFGIEYDGRAWHKNYKRDFEKDEVCYKNGITLLRVRELGCHKYNSKSIKKYINSYDMKELNEAIIFIFDYLNEHFNLNIKVDVNVDRDRVKILEQMNLFEKRNSIAKYCPEINDFWDKEKNGKITPEQISHASIKKIFLKCNLGHEWEMVARDFCSRPYCPYCSGHKAWPGFNDLFTTNPELKSFWANENKIDPTKIKKGCNKEAYWVCPTCNFKWSLRIQDMVKRKNKCHQCKNGLNNEGTENAK